MGDEETEVTRSGMEFSEEQLAAITGVVQRLLDRALSERGSGPATGGRALGTAAGPETAGGSGGTVPSSSRCRLQPNVNPSSSGGLGGTGATRLVVTALGPTVQRLLQAGLAPSTQRAYLAGKKKYLKFCQETGIAPLPVTEQKLIGMVAFAVNQGLKHQTIKCYLSAVRHLQISCGGGDPRVESMPLLELMLRGSRKEQSGIPKRTRLSITPSILEQLCRVWNRDSSDRDNIMLWAVCCVGFFGFFRSGELMAPEDGKFDPEQHLTMEDITLDNPADPQKVSVRLKQSKTDPFRLGVTIHLGKTNTLLCPVAALLSYLVVRGKQGGPLFQFRDGRTLTRSRLVRELRKALSSAGFKPEDYAGHSFRKGAATTAAACGVPVELIKTLGRWKSQAYQLYILIPSSRLSTISNQLAQSDL